MKTNALILLTTCIALLFATPPNGERDDDENPLLDNAADMGTTPEEAEQRATTQLSTMPKPVGKRKVTFDDEYEIPLKDTRTQIYPHRRTHKDLQSALHTNGKSSDRPIKNVRFVLDNTAMEEELNADVEWERPHSYDAEMGGPSSLETPKTRSMMYIFSVLRSREFMLVVITVAIIGAIIGAISAALKKT